MNVRTALIAIAIIVGHLSAAAQPARQPEVVCDLSPVLVGGIEGGKLRTDLSPASAEPMRLTFRDINPVSGSANMIVGDGASGVQAVGVTVDSGAIVYLHERPGVSKMLVTTGNEPSPEGWPAVASQHGWAGGKVTVLTLTGLCRMRARVR